MTEEDVKTANNRRDDKKSGFFHSKFGGTNLPYRISQGIGNLFYRWFNILYFANY